MYHSFDQGSKWQLPSKRYVEDCLYQGFKDISKECSAHSWIIDIREKAVQDCFTQEEWSAIIASLTKLPPLDPEIARLIDRYAKLHSVAEIHDYLDAHGPVNSEKVSQQERLAGRWLHGVYRAWANLCGSSESARHHSESSTRPISHAGRASRIVPVRVKRNAMALAITTTAFSLWTLARLASLSIAADTRTATNESGRLIGSRPRKLFMTCFPNRLLGWRCLA